MSELQRKIQVGTIQGAYWHVTVAAIHPATGWPEITKYLTRDEALELAALLTETANSLPSESEN
jgi:hypothetical protein